MIHELTGQSWVRTKEGDGYIYTHKIYNITVFESRLYNPMESYFDVFSEDIDEYIVYNNWMRIVEFIRFEHPEWDTKRHVIHIYNSQAIFDGMAKLGKDADYWMYDKENPEKCNILLCKSSQLDVGDVVMRNTGKVRISTSEDRRLKNRKSQGYYNHMIIGGAKREKFLANPDGVATYKENLKAWVWG